MLENFDIQKIVKTLTSTGGDYGDIFFENKSVTSIIFEDGKIEKVQSGTDCGIGLRVLSEGNTFYCFTTDIDQNSVINAAKELSKLVKSSNTPATVDFTKASGCLSDTIILPIDVDVNRKIGKILKGKDFLQKYDPRIIQFKIVYSDILQDVDIVNSRGSFVTDRRIQSLYMIHVVTMSDGLIQTAYDSVGFAKGFEMFDDFSIEELAKKVAVRAIMNLSAKKINGGTMPVVLSSEAGGTMIHEAVGHGLELDIVNNGMSIYSKDKVGELVTSPKITVVDDGTLPFMRGSQNFDDEGIKCSKNILVENGILKKYMNDVLNSIKDSVEPTGNGRRDSFRHKPIPRMTNTYIASGDDDPASILKSVDRGLFVTKMGGGQVNTVTGDFVFEVSEGYEIVNGEIGDRVRDTTLIGNGPEVMKMIDMVGNDLGFGIGTCGKDGQNAPVSDGQPTLRIPEIVVG